MLRIGTRRHDGITEVSLQGRLAGDWVLEVRRTLAGIDAAASGLTLDLFEVRYADDAGQRLLRELAAGGMRIGRRSSFVAALLEGWGREEVP